MEIPDFDLKKYQEEYIKAENKEDTFLGKFFTAAIAQKTMVTNKIHESGNMLAGYSLSPDPLKLASEIVKDAVKVGGRK